MATVEKLSTITPQHLWDELHVQKRQTDQASRLARQVLFEIETENFTDRSVAERHGEIARIAMVTSTAMLKNSTNWLQAKHYLIRSSHTVIDHYPLAATAEEAKKRGLYWQPVYRSESAQWICAQEVAAFFRNVNTLVDQPTLLSLAVGLEHLLDQKNTPDERFDLIRSIKAGDYFNATGAFRFFCREFGIDSQFADLDQIVTLSTIMMGKAAAHFDLQTYLLGVTNLKNAFQKQPSLGKFILSQLRKNTFFNLHQKMIEHRFGKWKELAVDDSEVKKVIEQLESLRFLGLSGGEVKKITP
jgi:hypothetical protein